MTSSHRQKFVGCKTTTVPIGYIGETKHNLREGYGVYTYTNSFFRYEGEWEKGIKQGYGRLKMRDGSFYEGMFTNGEITGCGLRYWSLSNNTYEGDFIDGEMNGTGIMKYGDGAEYEGDWVDNKREGEGQLKMSDGRRYQGSFYANKFHGEGSMSYPDGSTYDGGWINGMKHGHGLFTYDDKSIYEGQWRSDTMNGEGVLRHSSGMTYEGMWVNGRPFLEPEMLSFANEKEIIEVDQNNVVFDVCIECKTSDGEVAAETGRLLKLTAAVRLSDKISKYSSKSSPVGTQSSSETLQSSQSTTPQQTNVARMETPFGYEVGFYPLCFVTTMERNKRQDESREIDVLLTLKPNLGIDQPTPGEELEALEDKQGNSILHSQHKESDNVAPQKTLNGRAEFLEVMLPFVKTVTPAQSLLSVATTRDAESGAKSRNKGRKTTDIEQDIIENSGRRKKSTRAEEKLKESLNRNYCKPGEYVLIVEDITKNPFLDIRMKPIYIQVKVVKGTV